MPAKKLTLTVQPETLEAARRYAREHNTSISAVFSEFIHAVADDREIRRPRIPRGFKLEEIAGIARLPKGETVEDVLREVLEKEHGASR